MQKVENEVLASVHCTVYQCVEGDGTQKCDMYPFVTLPLYQESSLVLIMRQESLTVQEENKRLKL